MSEFYEFGLRSNL